MIDGSCIFMLPISNVRRVEVRTLDCVELEHYVACIYRIMMVRGR